mgnify:CR=1 FL=1
MRRLTGHFVHGIIAFDAFNRLTIRVQHLNPAARGCGARMSWGIDDPAELDRASPRLHCLEAAKALYTPALACSCRCIRACPGPLLASALAR